MKGNRVLADFLSGRDIRDFAFGISFGLPRLKQKVKPAFRCSNIVLQHWATPLFCSFVQATIVPIYSTRSHEKFLTESEVSSNSQF